jgi:coenzyme PQQ precursor peptide PqqA
MDTQATFTGAPSKMHAATPRLRAPSLRASSIHSADGFFAEVEMAAWTTPTIVEVCAGFEVTAYASAE